MIFTPRRFRKRDIDVTYGWEEINVEGRHVQYVDEATVRVVMAREIALAYGDASPEQRARSPREVVAATTPRENAWAYDRVVASIPESLTWGDVDRARQPPVPKRPVTIDAGELELLADDTLAAFAKCDAHGNPWTKEFPIGVKGSRFPFRNVWCDVCAPPDAVDSSHAPVVRVAVRLLAMARAVPPIAERATTHRDESDPSSW